MPMSSPWGTTESTRFLSSRSKPFMAERPRMRAITPRAMPIREEAEIKAMKPLRRRERL
ncbi:hypothetical protein D3C84_785390 [compost metagenome]